MIGSELPKGWKLVPLKEITSIIRGVSYPKEEAKLHPEENYVHILRGGNIQDGKIVFETDDNVYVNSSLVGEEQFVLKDDVVIVASTGSKKVIGKAATIEEDSRCISFGAFLLLLRTNVIDKRFHSYFFQTQYYRNTISSLAGGININNIKKEHIENLQIPLPPLTEQKQIAEKLDKLFDQIETIKEVSNKIPELLKNFRQQVLTYAVTGKLTEEWRKERQLDEWHTELAKDCCEKVQSGGTPKGGQFALSGIPFLKVYNIVGNKIDFESEPQYVSEEIQNSQIKKSITYPGDVIMNIVGPPLNKVAIIPDTYKEWNINQAITLFRPKEYLNNQYLYYFFCEGSSVNSVLDKTRGVVGQVNISLSQCRDFAISIPPMEEQLEIVKRVQTLFDILDDVERRYNTLCEKLDKLPQALLCKAFKGELV